MYIFKLLLSLIALFIFVEVYTAPIGSASARTAKHKKKHDATVEVVDAIREILDSMARKKHFDKKYSTVAMPPAKQSKQRKTKTKQAATKHVSKEIYATKEMKVASEVTTTTPVVITINKTFIGDLTTITPLLSEKQKSSQSVETSSVMYTTKETADSIVSPSTIETIAYSTTNNATINPTTEIVTMGYATSVLSTRGYPTTILTLDHIKTLTSTEATKAEAATESYLKEESSATSTVGAAYFTTGESVFNPTEASTSSSQYPTDVTKTYATESSLAEAQTTKALPGTASSSPSTTKITTAESVSIEAITFEWEAAEYFASPEHTTTDATTYQNDSEPSTLSYTVTETSATESTQTAATETFYTKPTATKITTYKCPTTGIADNATDATTLWYTLTETSRTESTTSETSPTETTATKTSPSETTTTETLPTESTTTEISPTAGAMTKTSPTEGTNTETSLTEGTNETSSTESTITKTSLTEDKTGTSPTETTATETSFTDGAIETSPSELTTTETSLTQITITMPTESAATETSFTDSTTETSPTETTTTETSPTETTTTETSPTESTATEISPTAGAMTKTSPTEGTNTETSLTEGTTETSPTESTITETSLTEGTTETSPTETTETTKTSLTEITITSPTEITATETSLTESTATETSPTETTITETSPTESTTTETSPAETTITETSPTETTITETSPTKNTATEISPTEGAMTKTSLNEGNNTETPLTEGTTETSPTESTITDTSLTEITITSPTEITATETSPTESTSTETSPTETTITESSPTESSATETSLTEDNTETSPTESPTTETSPTETTITETSPTETTATKTSPSETTTTEISPTEGAMTKTSPTEGTNTETSLTEGTTETSPTESTTTETSFTDCITATSITENTATETWPTESTTTETSLTEITITETSLTEGTFETSPTESTATETSFTDCITAISLTESTATETSSTHSASTETSHTKGTATKTSFTANISRFVGIKTSSADGTPTEISAFQPTYKRTSAADSKMTETTFTETPTTEITRFENASKVLWHKITEFPNTTYQAIETSDERSTTFESSSADNTATTEIYTSSESTSADPCTSKIKVKAILEHNVTNDALGSTTPMWNLLQELQQTKKGNIIIIDQSSTTEPDNKVTTELSDRLQITTDRNSLENSLEYVTIESYAGTTAIDFTLPTSTDETEKPDGILHDIAQSCLDYSCNGTSEDSQIFETIVTKDSETQKISYEASSIIYQETNLSLGTDLFPHTKATQSETLALGSSFEYLPTAAEYTMIIKKATDESKREGSTLMQSSDISTATKKYTPGLDYVTKLTDKVAKTVTFKTWLPTEIPTDILRSSSDYVEYSSSSTFYPFVSSTGSQQTTDEVTRSGDAVEATISRSSIDRKVTENNISSITEYFTTISDMMHTTEVSSGMEPTMTSARWMELTTPGNTSTFLQSVDSDLTQATSLPTLQSISTSTSPTLEINTDINHTDSVQTPAIECCTLISARTILTIYTESIGPSKTETIKKFITEDDSKNENSTDSGGYTDQASVTYDADVTTVSDVTSSVESTPWSHETTQRIETVDIGTPIQTERTVLETMLVTKTEDSSRSKFPTTATTTFQDSTGLSTNISVIVTTSNLLDSTTLKFIKTDNYADYNTSMRPEAFATAITETVNVSDHIEIEQSSQFLLPTITQKDTTMSSLPTTDQTYTDVERSLATITSQSITEDTIKDMRLTTSNHSEPILTTTKQVTNVRDQTEAEESTQSLLLIIAYTDSPTASEITSLEPYTTSTKVVENVTDMTEVEKSLTTYMVTVNTSYASEQDAIETSIQPFGTVGTTSKPDRTFITKTYSSKAVTNTETTSNEVTSLESSETTTKLVGKVTDFPEVDQSPQTSLPVTSQIVTEETSHSSQQDSIGPSTLPPGSIATTTKSDKTFVTLASQGLLSTETGFENGSALTTSTAEATPIILIHLKNITQVTDVTETEESSHWPLSTIADVSTTRTSYDIVQENVKTTTPTATNLTSTQARTFVTNIVETALPTTSTDIAKDTENLKSSSAEITDAPVEMKSTKVLTSTDVSIGRTSDSIGIGTLSSSKVRDKTMTEASTIAAKATQEVLTTTLSTTVTEPTRIPSTDIPLSSTYLPTTTFISNSTSFIKGEESYRPTGLTDISSASTIYQEESTQISIEPSVTSLTTKEALTTLKTTSSELFTENATSTSASAIENVTTLETSTSRHSTSIQQFPSHITTTHPVTYITVIKNVKEIPQSTVSAITLMDIYTLQPSVTNVKEGLQTDAITTGESTPPSIPYVTTRNVSDWTEENETLLTTMAAVTDIVTSYQNIEDGSVPSLTDETTKSDREFVTMTSQPLIETDTTVIKHPTFTLKSMQQSLTTKQESLPTMSEISGTTVTSLPDKILETKTSKPLMLTTSAAMERDPTVVILTTASNISSSLPSAIMLTNGSSTEHTTVLSELVTVTSVQGAVARETTAKIVVTENTEAKELSKSLVSATTEITQDSTSPAADIYSSTFESEKGITSSSNTIVNVTSVQKSVVMETTTKPAVIVTETDELSKSASTEIIPYLTSPAENVRVTYIAEETDVPHSSHLPMATKGTTKDYFTVLLKLVTMSPELSPSTSPADVQKYTTSSSGTVSKGEPVQKSIAPVTMQTAIVTEIIEGKELSESSVSATTDFIPEFTSPAENVHVKFITQETDVPNTSMSLETDETTRKHITVLLESVTMSPQSSPTTDVDKYTISSSSTITKDTSDQKFITPGTTSMKSAIVTELTEAEKLFDSSTEFIHKLTPTENVHVTFIAEETDVPESSEIPLLTTKEYDMKTERLHPEEITQTQGHIISKKPSTSNNFTIEPVSEQPLSHTDSFTTTNELKSTRNVTEKDTSETDKQIAETIADSKDYITTNREERGFEVTTEYFDTSTGSWFTTLDVDSTSVATKLTKKCFYLILYKVISPATYVDETTESSETVTSDFLGTTIDLGTAPDTSQEVTTLYHTKSPEAILSTTQLLPKESVLSEEYTPKTSTIWQKFVETSTDRTKQVDESEVEEENSQKQSKWNYKKNFGRCKVKAIEKVISKTTSFSDYTGHSDASTIEKHTVQGTGYITEKPELLIKNESDSVFTHKKSSESDHTKGLATKEPLEESSSRPITSTEVTKIEEARTTKCNYNSDFEICNETDAYTTNNIEKQTVQGTVYKTEAPDNMLTTKDIYAKDNDSTTIDVSDFSDFFKSTVHQIDRLEHSTITNLLTIKNVSESVDDNSETNYPKNITGSFTDSYETTQTKNESTFKDCSPTITKQPQRYNVSVSKTKHKQKLKTVSDKPLKSRKKDKSAIRDTTDLTIVLEDLEGQDVNKATSKPPKHMTSMIPMPNDKKMKILVKKLKMYNPNKKDSLKTYLIDILTNANKFPNLSFVLNDFAIYN